MLYHHFSRALAGGCCSTSLANDLQELHPAAQDAELVHRVIPRPYAAVSALIHSCRTSNAGAWRAFDYFPVEVTSAFVVRRAATATRAAISQWAGLIRQFQMLGSFIHASGRPLEHTHALGMSRMGS